MRELLSYINKPDDRLAMARLLDKAEFTAKAHRLAHSDFLDPHQVQLAEKLLSSVSTCEYSFFGGFAMAERAVVLFWPEFIEDSELLRFKNEILKSIEIKPLCRNTLSHRDYLGALMSLGIRREVTGDILVREESCSIIVLSEISQYITENLLKVGNIGVDVTISDIMELSTPEPRISEIKTTVAALRLDSLCAHSFGLSRGKAAEFIKAGKVQLNWEATLSVDKQVCEGDTISLRGKGKAVLDKVGGRTKKDRIAILIKKFV